MKHILVVLISFFAQQAFSQATEVHKLEVHHTNEKTQSVVFFSDPETVFTNPTPEYFFTAEDWRKFGKILKRDDSVLFVAYPCGTIATIHWITRPTKVYSKPN